MKTRVLQLISAHDAGRVRLFGQLAGRLRDADIECRLTLLGRHEDAAVASNGAAAARLPSTALALDPRGVRNLRRAVSDWSPHVVHATDRHSARYAAAGLGWRRQAALLIGPTPGSEERTTPWRLSERLALRRADRVLVADTNNSADAPQHVAMPVGMEPLTPDAAFRSALLEELSLPCDSKLIGVSGDLVPGQRVKDAIWAADLLKCVRDDVHLLVLGDGPHRWRLQRYRRQVLITDRVHFLGRRSDETSILASLDCYWHTGEVDEIAIPMLEAMSAGVPVVCSDLPAARASFDEATALLVPLGDRASRARHTNALLDDAERSQTLGRAGRQFVLDRFPLEPVVAAYQRLYTAHASAPFTP